MPTSTQAQPTEPDADLLRRQAQAAERIADYLTPQSEERRLTKIRRIASRATIRVVLVIGVVLGAWEFLVWLHGNWEIRTLANNNANVAREIFYRENNPEVAQGFLAKAIELNPNDPSYRFLESYIAGMAAARNLLNLDRPFTKEELDESHEALAKAIFLEQQFPGKPESEILRGQIYAALADYDRAANSIHKAIERVNLYDSRNVQGLTARVRSEVSSFFDSVGVTVLAKFVGDPLKRTELGQSRASTLSFAYVRLALIEKQRGQPGLASQHLDKALETDPNSKWAFLWRGIFQAGHGQWDTARENYDKALIIDPRFDLAYYNKAWTYLKERPKQYDAARIMFQRALSVNPDYKEANYGLGMVYGYQNKYDVALRYMSRAVEIDDKFLTGWKWRGIVNDELGDFETALSDFSTAISLDPSNDDLYVRRARVLRKQKSYDVALQDLFLAEDFNLKNHRIPFYIGQIYLDLAQFENAINEFGKAIEMDGNYVEAFIARAGAFEALGNSDDSLNDLNSAIAKVSYRPELAFRARANYFDRMGNPQAAANDFKSAREANPRDADAWLGEARSLQQLSQIELGKIAINEYLKLKPQSSEAKELKEALSKT